MSSRALRRLERKQQAELEAQKERTPLDESEEEFEEEEEEEEVVIHQKKVNAFAFLGDESDESDEENIDEVDEEFPVAVKETEPELEPSVEKVTLESKKSKKKKNKKNKKKQQQQQQQSKTVDDVDDDEFDRILSQAAKKHNQLQSVENQDQDEDLQFESVFDNMDEPMDTYGPGGKFFTINKFKKSLHLLELDPKNLDPDKEYEALFGKLSNAAIEDADSTSSTFITPEILKQIKQLSKRIRGWSGRDRRSMPGTSRKLTLTKIRDDWIPTAQKPLIMEEMTDDQLQAYFELTTDDWKDVIREDIKKEAMTGIRYYQLSEGPLHPRVLTTQFFISVVIAPDHEALIQLLQKSPYHLETLLQVASILQRQGDNSNTNGLIERALFIFDWSLKNTFNFGSGVCRLPFEFFLNRQVYLTLFRYITVLTQKSTFFTAFNYCKLLLSFNPADDPYGVRYFIDFYAFMATEYQYLIDLVDSPLITCYKEWFTPSLAYTVALCHFKLGKFEKAKIALKTAFEAHPYTGYLFLSKISDGFTWKHGKVSPPVELSTAVYIVRAGILCEEPEVKRFMITELTKIIGENPKLKKSHLDTLKEIPHNLMRHVILSNETSAMAKIPESFWKQHEIYEFDVLPPEHGTTIHNYINQNMVGDAMINRTLDAEEDRQIAELIRRTQLEGNE